MQFIIDNLGAFLLLALPLSFVAMAFMADRAEERALLQADKTGNFVAEVWLEWEICTGSTMYRARFATEKRAAEFAQRHAKELDYLLPTHYDAEYSNGRKYKEAFGFEIRWGVRGLTEYEKSQGVSKIWSTNMPGEHAYAGEPRDAHPSLRTWDTIQDLEFEETVQGLKV